MLIGAGGFVGPWIAQALTRHSFGVVALSRRPVPERLGVCAITGDITVPGTVADWIAGADAVVFNAAYLPKDYADPLEADACLRTNALAVLNVLASRPRAFVYISTAQGYAPLERAATELDAIFPTAHATYYLGSKLLGELYTEHYRLAYKLPVTTLRLGALYGPNLKTGMIANFIRQANSGAAIVLQDGGRFSSDLTYVADVGEAVAQTVLRKVSGIFNVGSGRRTSAIEAAGLVVRLIEADPASITVNPAGLGPAPGFNALDISRACRELKMVPTPVNEGLASTIKNWSR